MKGTSSKDADVLYKGILEYYANISGLSISGEQLQTRDSFIEDGALICEDSLDEEVLKLQEDFITLKGNVQETNKIVESAISLLKGL